MPALLRRDVEREIITAFVEAVLADGCQVRVNDGQERFGPFTGVPEVLEALFSVDQEHLEVIRGDSFVGWLFLVYANSGWDVISDYSTTLEKFVQGRVTALSNHYENTLEDYRGPVWECAPAGSTFKPQEAV